MTDDIQFGDAGDPINWPAPEPIFQLGLYHYICICPLCGHLTESDKGSLNPERRYRRHWWRRHVLGNWSA
jgi:hypothetical protein